MASLYHPNMRAAVYTRPGEPLIVKTVPTPEPKTGELLVQMVAATICGSDLAAYLGSRLGNNEGIVAGHEGVGLVVETGPGVTNFQVGDRVGFLTAIRTCHSCKPCLSGEGQFCESGKKNQGFDFPGFFAEYALVQADFAALVPKHLPLERMSPMFCAGITGFRAVKELGFPGFGLVGIFGVGGVGHFAVRFAKAMGLQVIGFDVSKPALDAALRSGADHVADSTDEKAMQELVNRISGGAGLDGAIVASGATQAYGSAIKLTGFKGTIVAVGVPREPTPVSILDFIKKGIILRGTQTGNPIDIKEMMKVADAYSIVPEVNLQSLDALPALMHSFSQGQTTGKVGVMF
ncbi:chaperonin 10-like protein [Aspergillus navahoensis]